MSLIPASQIPKEFWPEILNQNHSDWFFNSNTPRWKTAAFGIPPVMVDGNADQVVRTYREVYPGVWKPCQPQEPGAWVYAFPLAVPKRGQWWKSSEGFVASTTSWGLYYRQGPRWDDVDGYYELNSFKVGLV